WRELAAADQPAEVVVMARPPQTAEPASAAQLAPVFERTISLTDHSVLRSHVLNDKAVVPFVLHLEWMAHAAMHGNPGLKFHGFDDLRIFQGIHVDEATPAELRVLCGRAAKRDGLFAVPVEVHGTKNRREVTYSRAEILLVDRLPDPEPASAPPPTEPYDRTVEDVYDDVLFHGPDLRALERIDGLSAAGIVAAARTAPAPGEWMEHPVRGSWIADPLALDAAFQMLVLWTVRRHGAASLPCFAGRYRQFRRSFPAEGITITLKVKRDSAATAQADVEFLDADGRLVAKMTDAEHVMDASLNDAFRRGRLAHAGSGARVGEMGS
ncbi:MAG TPA: polyketide synthase dehydratase domain-containing protein, partial [Gemmataceae bacterium]|nr:polyketide synthase dehydratase domain-containing protein [Gemmataceae bacterium]